MILLRSFFLTASVGSGTLLLFGRSIFLFLNFFLAARFFPLHAFFGGGVRPCFRACFLQSPSHQASVCVLLFAPSFAQSGHTGLRRWWVLVRVRMRCRSASLRLSGRSATPARFHANFPICFNVAKMIRHQRWALEHLVCSITLEQLIGMQHYA